MSQPTDPGKPPARKSETKERPLHKDLSFWIVVVILVGAANYTQFYFGFPWLKERFQSMRVAPRMTNAPAPTRMVSSFDDTQGLDTSKKTYPWQTARPDMQAIQAAPVGTIIIPTEFSSPSGGWSTRQQDWIVGIRLPLGTMLQMAYEQQGRSRMELPPDLPNSQFDFLSKSPGGATTALQEEIKKKFGLVAVRESRQMDALVLKVERPDALKPLTPPFAPITGTQEVITLRSVRNLVSIMEQILRKPVIDQTGLTEMYDIQLPQSAFRSVAPGQSSDNLNQLKTILLDKYGVQLIQTNTTVEMLVVKEEKVTKQ